MSLLIKSGEIWVATQPVDFRKSIDGLCIYIQEYFVTKPQEGFYIFYNRARNRLKMLVWHYNGFMLLYKRLERGHFPFEFSPEAGKLALSEKQLQGLLLGLDWQGITAWEGISFEHYY